MLSIFGVRLDRIRNFVLFLAGGFDSICTCAAMCILKLCELIVP